MFEQTIRSSIPINIEDSFLRQEKHYAGLG